MENEINPEIIKTTQVSLGKYVKRPPLSEKLLKKPPFRFLHDIITTVLKTTGFFENLFDQEELLSDNVKDRDSKIAFLNKVIYVLSSTTGKTLSVKPSKIVAGQEPDKTNELLQCLAIALDKNLSSEEAVKKYKESLNSSQASETKTTTKTGETKASKSVKKGNDSKKLISKSSEKLIDHKNETNLQSTSKNNKDKINENKFKRKEISNKIESHPKKSQQTKASSIKAVDNKRQNSEDTEGKSVKKSKDIERKSIKNSARSSVKEKLQPEISNKLQSQDSNVSVDKENQTGVKINEELKSPRIEQDAQISLNDSYTIGEPDLNSATSTHDLVEPVNAIVEDKKSLEINVITNLADIGDELSIESNKADDDKNNELGGNYQAIVNPTIKHNNQNNEHELKNKEISPPKSANDFNQIVRPQSVRPSSSRPGAPRMREKLESIVRDTDNLILGKVNIIVENTQNEEEEETSIVVVEDQQVELTPISNDKDLNISSKEHGHLVQQILDSHKELSQIGGKTEIEWQFGAQKARAAVNQEIEQLKFNIQALSRVANPLGKLLDHVQEDVEVMRQELHQWTNIYEEVSKEMLKQKAINENSLLPLHTKLRHLERDIEEKREKINDIKVLINRNESRIEKLLANGDVQ